LQPPDGWVSDHPEITPPPNFHHLRDTTDDYLGDHWLGEKKLFHEESVRIPLVVYDLIPAADATRGTADDALADPRSSTYFQRVVRTIQARADEGSRASSPRAPRKA
jgi:hypothetical protein